MDRKVLILRAVLALMVVAVAAGYFIWRRPASPPQVTNSDEASIPLSSDELAGLAAEARVAIGHLENEQFSAADQILTRMRVKLPREPLVARNLAICRLLTLESAATSVSSESVQESLAALAKVEPESAVAKWLAARAQLKLYEQNIANPSGARYRDAALQQLREATRREPGNAAFWYETYDACKDGDEPSVQSEGIQALHQAFRAAPNNLRVAIEWLLQHVTAKDPELIKSLPVIRKLIEPIAAGVQRRTNANVLDFFDRLKDAVEKEQWGPARGAATAVRNFLISEEITRSDSRLVLKNPLEFVLYEFSPEVRMTLAKVTTSPPPGIPVTFASVWEGGRISGEVRDAEFTDFDLDGQPEMAVLTSDKLEVWKLQPDGQLGATLTSVAVPEGMRQLLLADLDRDTIITAGAAKAATASPGQPPPFYEADPDILMFGEGGARVLKNELADDGQTRSLETIAQDPTWESLRQILTGVLADIDHDGDLDAILSVAGHIQVWWNRDNLTFEDATRWSQLPPSEMRVDSLTAADWDRDVDIDILVGGAGMRQSGLLENLRHGQVRWQAFRDEFASIGAATHLAVWEADGNASWDLLAVGSGGASSLLTWTAPATAVKPLRGSTLVAAPYQHATLLDYDNDGSTDILLTGDTDAALFRGRPSGDLSAVTGVLPALANFAVADAVDADRDGDIDLLTMTAGKLSLLRNDGGNKNHWLSVRVRGEAEDRSGRVNHFGFGSLVELSAGSSYQAQTVARQTVHFGLGSVQQADVLRVLFTNGIPQSVIQPQANQLVSEKMINKGSCPFVYAWNGKRMEFVTDLLWNAPLGLQLADGVIAKDRPWEYLKIRGDQLVPKDGQYEVRVTEELWEAGYFDQIELIAVDHPQEVEVYSNEKVGPAELAEPKVHTVRRRRSLVSARSPSGRDLLPLLSRVDGERAVPFDRTLRKGRAEPHYLELDFGPLESPRQITLFLTGWIQPGDTSLSVAASHNPELSPGQPPSIWTPDSTGEWKQTVPLMGFPGGKPKTIAVDLTGAFASHDYRVRIATDFELYWDEAFFTVDEEPVETQQTSLPLVFADLHFRGFSAVTPFDGPRPETFDYSRSDSEPRWPPMQGRFTRFGDARELLITTDRRLAVLAAGDEITLRFTAPPPTPEGWSRDFLLHSVGWDKDADLNTVLGQTVEPLPFVGMSGYPYTLEMTEETGARGANTEFDEYLRTYQTREVSPAPFWRNWHLPRNGAAAQ